jgi:hypothetical protein
MEYQYKGHSIIIHKVGSHFYLTINKRTVDKIKKESRRTVELNGNAGAMSVHIKIFPKSTWQGPPRIVTFIDGVELPVPKWIEKMYQYNGHEIIVNHGEKGGQCLKIDGHIIDRDGAWNLRNNRELNGTVDGVPVRVNIKMPHYFFTLGLPVIKIVTFIDGAEVQAIMVAEPFSHIVE